MMFDKVLDRFDPIKSGPDAPHDSSDSLHPRTAAGRHLERRFRVSPALADLVAERAGIIGGVG